MHVSILLLLCNLGLLATAHAEAPRDNLSLPTDLKFEARKVGQPWVDAHDMRIGVNDANANCTEMAEGSWRNHAGDRLTAPECQSLGERPPHHEIYALHAVMQRTSLTPLDTAGDRTRVRLDVQLGELGDTVVSARWCALPWSGNAPELDLTLSPQQACERYKGIEATGASVRFDVPTKTEAVAYWLEIDIGGGKESDIFVWGLRDLEGNRVKPLTKDREVGPSSGPLPLALASKAAPRAPTGGIDQGAILIGLTDYLVARADSELRAWAVDSQLRDLCATNKTPGNQPLPGDFLENTCGALQDQGISLLFSGASALQNTARDDLRAFLRNLGEAGVLQGNGQVASVDTSGLRVHDVFAALAVLGRTLELVLDGQRPESALAGFAADGRWAEELAKITARDTARLREDYPVTVAMYLSSAILASLPLKDGQIDLPDDADAVAELAPWIAAAVQYNLEVAGMDEVIFGGGMPDTAARVEEAALAVMAVVDEARITALYEAIHRLHADSVSLLDPDAVANNRRAMLRAYAAIAHDGLTLAADCASAAAMTANAPNLRPLEAWIDDAGALAGALAGGDYGSAIVTGLDLSRRLAAVGSKASSAVAPDPALLSSLAFIASLAESDSPQAARDTIEAWAAPIGSYMRKHDGDGFYAGINAYVGLSGGAEWIVNLDEERALSRPAGQLAPTMMIGVDFGHRFPDEGYLGGFASLLDLGALATVRVDASTDEDVQVDYASKLRFQQVLSPGIYLLGAPRRAPFAIGLGASLAPSMREITEDGEILERDYTILRASALIALDLPLNP